VADWSGLRLSSAAELRKAATFTATDKERVRKAVAARGGLLAKLLDAAPVPEKPHPK